MKTVVKRTANAARGEKLSNDYLSEQTRNPNKPHGPDRRKHSDQLSFAASVLADGQGPITDMHYPVWDTDQSSAICFEVGSVALAFPSNGSEKHKVISALLISAFMAGKTISYSAAPNPLSRLPCQSWELPSTVY
jgi:hypothetical protein